MHHGGVRSSVCRRSLALSAAGPDPTSAAGLLPRNPWISFIDAPPPPLPARRLLSLPSPPAGQGKAETIRLRGSNALILASCASMSTSLQLDPIGPFEPHASRLWDRHSLFNPAFSPHCRDSAFPRPTMMSSGTGRFRSRHDTAAAKTAAISIPGVDDRVRAPPALPPPTHLPIGDVHQQPATSREKPRISVHDSASLVSGYGSMTASYAHGQHPHEICEPRFVADGDEGYASYAPIEGSRNDKPLTDFGVHHSKFHFQTPADSQMKKKLDKSRGFDKAPLWPLITSSVSDIGPAKVEHQSSILSVPNQLPIHSRHAMPESPARLVKAPTFPAASPWSSTSQHLSRDRHLYSDLLENERSPLALYRAARAADESSAAPTSYGSPATDDTDMDDAPSMKRLHIDDADSFSGSRFKRAAASPPSEETLLHCVSGQGDVIRRRDPSSRESPPHRRHLIPHLSAAAVAPPLPPAAAVSRSTSYMSSAVSLPPTTITPGTSFTRRSPCDTSTGNMSPYSCGSPRSTPTSSTHSPRTSISGRGAFHVRNPSAASPRRAAGVSKANGAKIQGFYMCECCPKKPKKFETAVELHAHEAEKQYSCAFCRNRFKNKNEAERHQNSLHVRRHSWSCSALAGCERAFHDSTTHPGEADTCGFCGEEFARSGISPGNRAFNGCVVPRYPTERDWEERIRHLQDVHKFAECNAAKKFYRADHFRQHLKHSHAGTSGKWTNMLENACMVEEVSPR